MQPTNDGPSTALPEFVAAIPSTPNQNEVLRSEPTELTADVQYRLFFDKSPDPMAVFEYDGRVRLANPQAVRLMGFATFAEMQAKCPKALDYIAPEDHDRIQQSIRDLAKSEAPSSREYTAIRADGSRFPIELSTALLYENGKQPTAMMCVARDVTERVEMESALANAADEWAASFDSMTDGVSLVDLDHTILNANSSLCRMLGKSKIEIVGKKCYEAIHHKDSPIIGCPLETSLCTKCTEHAEMFDPLHDAWLASSVYPVKRRDGTMCSVVHVIKDITERKRAEEGIRQAHRRAEAANRAKSEFLANMSHEIRTPMTAILGFTDLLMGPEVSPDEQQEYLQTIARNGKSLLVLINEILDLSKIEAGSMSVESVACSLHRLMDDVLGVAGIRAREKGLSLDVAYEDGVPDTVHTDPTRLRQILMNLVGNAVKFTEHGGVHITVRRPTPESDASMLQVTVADTGIGIPSEKLQELFQPFTQADASMTRRFGGTGLGLAISKRLAKLLGGDIEVASDLGRGSTFTLTVDIRAAAAEQPPAGRRCTQREAAPGCPVQEACNGLDCMHGHVVS